MEKHDLRRRLSNKMIDKILPHVTKDLNAKSRNLNYVIHRGHNNTAEIQGTTKELKTWRHTIDLDNRTCSCNRWQITGLPCTHALCFINSLRNKSAEDYIDDYYSVDVFKKAYAGIVMPMTDRNQWPKVDMGFKLWPPILKRAAGRPRTRRMKGAEEGGRTSGMRQCMAVMLHLQPHLSQKKRGTKRQRLQALHQPNNPKLEHVPSPLQPHYQPTVLQATLGGYISHYP